MRIGTWNLDGRWDARHVDLLESLDCDVLLLTELAVGADLPGYTSHHTSQPMLDGKHWAAVLARGTLVPLPDPQPTTAMAEVDGIRVAASVLPWKGCAPYWPGPGSDTTERTRHAVDAIAAAAPEIWGGDWNHSLTGPELSGSQGGRAAIEEAVAGLGLQVPTTDSAQSQRTGSGRSTTWPFRSSAVMVSAEQHSASLSGTALSDHDAYVVEMHMLEM